MILGKVAQILSDEEVIINVGTRDSVKNGMEFVIFAEGEHVLDPESSEDLGAIEIVKGRVKVSHAMERMSRARTKTYVVDVLNPLWDPVLLQNITGAPRRTETRTTKLTVSGEDLRPVTEDRVVRLGDSVRSVEE